MAKQGRVVFILFLLLIPAVLFAATARAAGIVTQCNETAFKNALSGGGTVSFGCSGTITLTSEAVIDTHTVIDGSGHNVVLNGNNTTRILRVFSTSANPRSLTLRHLTLANGRAAPTAAMPDAARGGAIMLEHQAVLTAENVDFIGNTAVDGASAIFGWFESRVTIDHCRFADNDARAGNDERGGAIAFIGPNALTVRNSEFSNNRGIVGAAINTINARLTIENSRFNGNDTLAAAVDNGEPRPELRGYGGAVYTDRGTVVMRHNVFDNNRARSAGGAAALHLATQQSHTIEDNIFTSNQALTLPGPNGPPGSGGALYLFGLEPNLGAAIERNLFAGNRAVSDSGALRIQRITATLINNTFFDNATTTPLTPGYTGGIGGAIAIFDDNPVAISHATFARNYAGWVGGAIVGNAQTTVDNSIFYQNTAANGTNSWGIEQHTDCGLSGSSNIQFPNNGTSCAAVTPGIVTANPALAVLADNGGFSRTMALQPGSPAIDATGNSCADVDQRGFARPLPCDLGAFDTGAMDAGLIFSGRFE